MKYPIFFDKIETIKLQDDLSDFLGVLENGLIEFSYIDIVKSAGHSCPTVAGAYLMCLEGLKALYKNDLPKRGEILVFFKEADTEGVAGVIGNVVTQITGATAISGFKGIAGKFKRNGLMKFNDNITSGIKLQRVDNGNSVEIIYNPNSIQPEPLMIELLGKFKNSQELTDNEKRTFGKLWQKRVEKIFDNIDQVISVRA